MRRWPIALALFALAALSLPTRAALAHQLCFGADKTPHCLNDPFSDYWETNGGLPVFGYPITTAANEPNRDTGQTYLTQWVERNRMEDHPENTGTPYRVLLGRLGAERLAQLGRDPNAEGRESGAQAGCLWFPETGHNVCDQTQGVGFKTYWENHGLALPGVSKFGRSLQLFGLPLTAPKMETNAAGFTVMTQWFERARFEWHPGNPDNFKVLLGLLGREVATNPGLPPPPAPTPPPAGAPAPLPPSFNNCQEDPQFGQAPNYPVKIVAINDSAELVKIHNVSDTPVDLTGWRLCSVRGNQLHGTLSGSLAPGEQRDIPSQATGNIWNNNDNDPGALYDANGSLVSYWPD